MSNVRLICKVGSKACKAIVKNTGIVRYRGKRRHPKTDILINYGLAGHKQENYYKLYPSAREIPTINKYVGHSKFYAVKKVEKAGLLIPETKLSLCKNDTPKEWLEKRVHSIGGRGIRRARGRIKIKGKYYQKNVKDRSYELRIHAFLWTSEWGVYKRLGEKDTIAWNFSNGGHFVTVHHPKNITTCKKAIEISHDILKLFKMAFGAVDFIVDSNNNLFFIEINSAPGFSGLSDHWYFDAFKALQKMPKQKALSYAV